MGKPCNKAEKRRKIATFNKTNMSLNMVIIVHISYVTSLVAVFFKKSNACDGTSVQNLSPIIFLSFSMQS